MKLIVQTQLLPDDVQSARLKATVERFNAAANFVAGVAFEHRTANVFELRKLCYHEVRERFGLSSQMTQLAIKCARDAYCRDKTIRPAFRPHAAMPFDQRTMSFKGIDRVSLLTLEGRIIVPFVLGIYQAERMALPKGQSDLVLREDGKWFLIVTVDVPEAAPIPATDFIGVDLGIALEDLSGIRERTRARGGDARNRLSGWAFAQLGAFIAYKAQLAGVPVVHVDPRYTSQTCPECGHRDRSNRKSQSEFRCKGCGHEDHADINAARNIRNAALSPGRALVAPVTLTIELDNPRGLSRKATGL
jgi:IS605 OrfB family transposase